MQVTFTNFWFQTNEILMFVISSHMNNDIEVFK